ncbi:hypothetical protein NEOLEDRAFT_163483 [Neolentinus lepideus HHB14362 ss-1]|uniref:Uncharacterized protein n=1 Tax=Neolentinus lepideus HHB14362 ss-1 TaxID=1314782 RepID=A0A165TUR5_9AGAM|nr:hypothetical protein NEOLEDRAFT_163483 [Neolentinus lepideus HHB14362 ss-1]
MVGVGVYEDSYSSSLGSVRHALEGLKGNDFLDGSLVALNKYPSVKDGPGFPGRPAKRKRQIVCDTFSDLQGPMKRERSLQIVNQSSFDVSDKVEELVFSSRNGTSEEEVLCNQDDTLVDTSAKLQSLEGSPSSSLVMVSDLYAEMVEKMNCTVLTLARSLLAIWLV